MGILLKIKYYFKLYFFSKKWRNANKHNKTTVRNVFSLDIVKVGKMSYGPLEILTWNAQNEMLQIGNFVSISSNVKFILGGNHNYKTFSTYPFKSIYMGQEHEALSKGPIIVEDDVWIGMNSLILSGVKINKGAVVGAGSVVTKDVPAYSIVAGNPARVIKYRFNEEIIRELLDFKYDKIDGNFIENNIEKLYKNLDTIILKELKG